MSTQVSLHVTLPRTSAWLRRMFVLGALLPTLHAQDGSLDTGFDPGAGHDSYVYSIVRIPGGKLLIAGSFSEYDGVPRGRIARLEANGSLDLGFGSGAGASGTILEAVLQPDGKALICGDFTTYDGVSRRRIARLDADGSLDTGFDPGTGASSSVHALALQPDGRILIGGGFGDFHGVPRNRIARLHADGSLDTGFDPGAGADATIRALVVQPDGRILISGSFSNYGGVLRKGLARIHGDGSLDTSFTPGDGTQPSSLVLLPDGRILIGGYFADYGGVPREGIARIHPDGSLDLGFDPGAGVGSNLPPFFTAIVWTIALQPDGKVLVGGHFDTFDGLPRSRIARLHANGSLDTSFAPGTGVGPSTASSAVTALALQPNGTALIGGEFDTYAGASRRGLARVFGYGSFAEAYCFGDGAGTPCPCGNVGGSSEGCANSSGSGAVLTATGSASVGAADLVLRAAGLPPNQFGTYIQGNSKVNAGSGAVFGDGLRCAGGSVVRLELRLSDYDGRSSTTIDLVAKGEVSPGDTRTYQLWFRDPSASPCGQNFNLTQGLALTWGP